MSGPGDPMHKEVRRRRAAALGNPLYGYGCDEDGELIALLGAMLDRLAGADRTRAAVIIQRATSLRRPLMAGWQV